MKKIYLISFLTGCLLFLDINNVLAFEGFYTLGDQNIEFRLAGEVNDIFFQNKGNWPIKKDIHGKEYYISQEACINKADIEGILIEPFTEDEKNQTIIVNGKKEKALNIEDNPNKVIIYFKKDSWKKIRKLTEYNISNHMAIIKEDQIIKCLRIMGRIDKEAVIQGLDLSTMEFLLRSLKIENKPSSEQREIEYKNWLIDNIKSDRSYAWDLNSIGVEYSNAEDYQNAIPIFELLINCYPSSTENYFYLGDCYFKQMNYDNAISVFEKGISLQPDPQFEVMMQIYIGDCYIAKEQYSLALDKYMLFREKVKTGEYPNKNTLLQFLDKKINDLKEKIK